MDAGSTFVESTDIEMSSYLTTQSRGSDSVTMDPDLLKSIKNQPIIPPEKKRSVKYTIQEVTDINKKKYREIDFDLLPRFKTRIQKPKILWCSLCGSEFSSEANMKSHMAYHKNTETFKCDECDKVFARGGYLREHKQRIHCQSRPHVCPICPKAFAQTRNLRLHMRIHTGEKPYKCSTCHRAFAQRSNYMAHKASMTGCERSTTMTKIVGSENGKKVVLVSPKPKNIVERKYYEEVPETTTTPPVDTGPPRPLLLVKNFNCVDSEVSYRTAKYDDKWASSLVKSLICNGTGSSSSPSEQSEHNNIAVDQPEQLINSNISTNTAVNDIKREQLSKLISSPGDDVNDKTLKALLNKQSGGTAGTISTDSVSSNAETISPQPSTSREVNIIKQLMMDVQNIKKEPIENPDSLILDIKIEPNEDYNSDSDVTEQIESPQPSTSREVDDQPMMDVQNIKKEPIENPDSLILDMKIEPNNEDYNSKNHATEQIESATSTSVSNSQNKIEDSSSQAMKKFLDNIKVEPVQISAKTFPGYNINVTASTFISNKVLPGDSTGAKATDNLADDHTLRQATKRCNKHLAIPDIIPRVDDALLSCFPKSTSVLDSITDYVDRNRARLKSCRKNNRKYTEDEMEALQNVKIKLLEGKFKVSSNEEDYNSDTESVSESDCDLGLSKSFLQKSAGFNPHVSQLMPQTGNYKIKCDICLKLTQFDKVKGRHLFSEGDAEYYQVCDNCEQDVLKIRYLCVEINRCDSKEQLYSCYLCCKPFSQQYELINHAAYHIRQKANSCAVCGKETLSVVARQGHFVEHMDKSMVIECRTCTINFLSAGDFLTHECLKILRKNETVDICNVFAKSSNDVKVSGQSLDDSGETQSIPTFTSIFNHRGNLFCAICRFTFVNKENYERHMDNHMTGKMLKCDICFKEFAREVYIKAHKSRCHAAQGKFMCKFCGKGFRETRNLLLHVRVHFGRKPYKCSKCKSVFTQRTNAVNHVETHHPKDPMTRVIYYPADKRHNAEDFMLKEGEKAPFLPTEKSSEQAALICEFCHNGVKDIHELNKHFKLHKQHPYKCPICSEEFLYKHYITRHIESLHRDATIVTTLLESPSGDIRPTSQPVLQCGKEGFKPAPKRRAKDHFTKRCTKDYIDFDKLTETIGNKAFDEISGASSSNEDKSEEPTMSGSMHLKLPSSSLPRLTQQEKRQKTINRKRIANLIVKNSLGVTPNAYSINSSELHGPGFAPGPFTHQQAVSMMNGRSSKPSKLLFNTGALISVPRNTLNLSKSSLGRSFPSSTPGSKQGYPAPNSQQPSSTSSSQQGLAGVRTTTSDCESGLLSDFHQSSEEDTASSEVLQTTSASGTEDVSCKLCWINFDSEEDFYAHMSLNHPGQKNYKCKICNTEFILQSALTFHMMVHPKVVGADTHPAGSSKGGGAPNQLLCPKTKPCDALAIILDPLTTDIKIEEGSSNYSCELDNSIDDNCSVRFQQGGASAKTADTAIESDCMEINMNNFSKSATSRMDLSHIKTESIDNHDSEGIPGPSASAGPTPMLREQFQTAESSSTISPEHIKAMLNWANSEENVFNLSQTGPKRVIQIPQRRVKPVDVKKCIKCHICGMVLKDKVFLKEHLYLHLGLKPFKCEQCDHKFAKKDYLNEHMQRIHSGLKPFKCSECDKCFSTKRNLNLHLRGHFNVEPYQCGVCLKRFKTATAYKYHTKRNHLEKTSSE
ncbi:zinc finger protein Xfin [Patella vulgata]|uniref:zinc finger protein Xfin n=1 Tax=Patella vulgata TaxID=6465 RepID=UPI0021808508|nr:zinc finger protein Xfin [Patella vulgata]